MNPMDRQDFDALKRALEHTYRQAFPSVTAPIESWKGEEITRFQEALTAHVQGRVSEKWFYTHIKGEQNALPRRSVLDMLSQYTGATDWQDFRNRQRTPEPTPAAPAKKRQRLPWVMGGAVLLVLTGTLYAALGLSQQHTFRFCFVDADRNQPITDGPIAVLVLEDGQSPVYQACDAQGCIQLQTARDQIRFAVHAPYFR
ncbi:MAG: hypothetical protein AAGB22_14095, partial [Bacteroidota bacterium]